MSQQDVTGSPQGNWLLNQMHGAEQRHPGSLVMPDADSAADDPFTVFIHAVTSNGIGDAIFDAVSGLVSAVATMIDINDPKAAMRLGVVQILTVLEDMLVAALAALDKIVQAALTFGSTGAEKLLVMFGTKLNWGYINDLYTWVQTSAGVAVVEEMTLGGLLFLIAGFPATVAYKLIMGVDHAPFPDGSIILPAAPEWSSSYSAPLADQVQSPGNYNAAMASLQGISGMIGGMIGAPSAVFNDLNKEIPVWLAYLEATGDLFGSTVGTIPSLYVPQEDATTAWNSVGASGAWAGWSCYMIASFACAYGNQISLKNLGVIGGAVCGLFGAITLGFGCSALEADRKAGHPARWPGWVAGICAPLSNLVQWPRLLIEKLPDTNPWSRPLKLFAAVLDSGLNFTSSVVPGFCAALAQSNLLPVIQRTHLADAYVGIVYTDGYRTDGGTSSFNSPLQSFSVSRGALPPGMGLAQQTSTKSGTTKNCWFTGAPTTVAGSPFTFSVTCTDSFQPPLYAEPTQFSITVKPTPVTGLRLRYGHNQSAQVGTAFTIPLSVGVTISSGMVGAGVLFTVVAAANGASGTFVNGANTMLVTSDANGHAAAALTANAIPGSYQVTATVPGVPQADTLVFTVANTRSPVASPVP